MVLGDVVFTLTVAVDASTPAGTVIRNTATISSSTPDPSTGEESATATTTVQPPPTSLVATKSVAGTFLPGGAITYTIAITNDGTSTQQDNPGNELVDVLPPQLTLASANATSGTASATIATNTVTWNGSIAAGATVTITINATVSSTATTGTNISNQATAHYDADNNGTNESSRQSDSTAQPGAADPTAFAVGNSPLVKIPTLDELVLLVLAAMLAMVALLVMKRA